MGFLFSFPLSQQPGGYLTTVDDVVEPFHLPRDVHQYDAATVGTTRTARLGGDDDRGRPHACLQLGEAMGVVAASVSRDRLPAPNGDDADGEMEVEAEVADLLPQPRKGVPKTMLELAESYAQRQGELEVTPPSQREKEEDGPAMLESDGLRERVLEEEMSRGRSKGAGRTAKRSPGTRTRTRTTRTSKKRARRRSGSEGASDVDGGEEAYGTPPKRPRPEASVALDATSTPVSSTPNAVPGRVLRPRPQKSTTQLRQERATEEAYRRAVAD